MGFQLPGELQQSFEFATRKTISTADPGAGAEISHTVPAGVSWRLIGVLASLVTSAVVANRLARLVINDGTDDVLSFPAPAVHAASLTNQYQWAPVGVGASVTTAQLAPIPGEIILRAGDVIKTSTALIDAGDNWGVARIVVMEWPTTS